MKFPKLCIILLSLAFHASGFAQSSPVGPSSVVPPIAVIKDSKDTKQSPSPFENALPADAEDALLHATQGTFYSIDPDSIDYSAKEQVTNATKFHGFKILGKMDLASKQLAVVTKEFLDEVKNWNPTMGATTCMITPRHALQLKVKDHVYDFLLCYQCGLFEVYKDGKGYKSLEAVRGSPKLLNDILTAAHIPLPKQSP